MDNSTVCIEGITLAKYRLLLLLINTGPAETRKKQVSVARDPCQNKSALKLYHFS